MGNPRINWGGTMAGAGLLAWNRAGLGAGLLAASLLIPFSASGQTRGHAFGTGIHFQGFSFSEALGADDANLTLLPVGYTLPVGRRVSLDFYGAYAHGTVQKDGTTFTMKGPVDTRVRGSFQITPWAVFTAAVNLPTGDAAHDLEEAVVASVLSTDILGFQEASWGTGAAVTAGVASAYEAGEWGIGFGASYRLSNGFEPAEDVSLTYEPGDEIRIRLGLDRNVGDGGKLTLGLTFQNFSEDQFGGQNLFQAGNRLRGDISYAFRTGRSTWSLYAMDVWRESGDFFTGQGIVAGDAAVTTGSQNLLILGMNGSTPAGATFRIRPSLDFRYQAREEGTGAGWLLGGGLDVPLRIPGSWDLLPRVKYSYGALEALTGETETLWGVELGVTLRGRL